MGGALRILQAGGFRFHQPISAIDRDSSGRLSTAQKHQLVEARYRTAEKILQLARQHDVSLVVLTESPADLRGEAMATWFLLDQLEQLHHAQIDVVWVGCSRSDLPEWANVPASLRFLPNKHSIGFRLSSRPQTVEIEWTSVSGDQQVASQTADLKVHLWKDGTPTLGNGLALEYSVRNVSDLAQHPATNSRRQQQGAWMTDWTPGHRPTCHFEITQPVNRVRETATIHPDDSWESLRSRLRAVCEKHAQSAAHELTVIDWTIAGCGNVWNELISRQGQHSLRDQLDSPAVTGHHPVITGRLTLNPDPQQWSTWQQTPAVAVGWHHLQTLLQDIQEGHVALATAPQLRHRIQQPSASPLVLLTQCGLVDTLRSAPVAA